MNNMIDYSPGKQDGKTPILYWTNGIGIFYRMTENKIK